MDKMLPGDRRGRANGSGNEVHRPGRPILGPIAMSAKTRFLFNMTHGSERRMIFIACDGGTGPLANWRHGIPFHSFGRFGSPIFNQSGHLVGISYQDYEAWSVMFLQQAVLREAEISSALGSVSYVLNGNPIPREVPILPKGPVPPV
uniref:Uncharacterized protein n=1 Tax=Triticum urartu TaxID=4572 RepID=A0A8R7QAN7_TRIUA